MGIEDYERELTPKEKIEVMNLIFMDDEDFYKNFVSDLNEEEYQRFLIECPEFLEEMEKSKRKKQMREQKKERA